VEDALNDVREALKGEDYDRIKKAQENLEKSSHKLAEAMYRDAQGGAAGAKAGPTADAADGQRPAGGPKDGEVVDAEFEDLGGEKKS